MRQRRNIWPSLLTIVVLITLGAVTTVGLAYATTGRHGTQSPAEKYALAPVRRTDLYPALTASGRVESSTADGDRVRAREHHDRGHGRNDVCRRLRRSS